jgi:hypothetical protein
MALRAFKSIRGLGWSLLLVLDCSRGYVVEAKPEINRKQEETLVRVDTTGYHPYETRPRNRICGAGALAAYYAA